MADLKEHLKQLKLESQVARNNRSTANSQSNNQPPLSGDSSKQSEINEREGQNNLRDPPKTISTVRKENERLFSNISQQQPSTATESAVSGGGDIGEPPQPAVEIVMGGQEEDTSAIQLQASQNSTSSETNTCPICLQQITSRSVLEPCCHEFDYACIKEWANNNSHCPYCRIPTIAIMFNIQTDSLFDREPVIQRLPEDVDFDSDSSDEDVDEASSDDIDSFDGEMGELSDPEMDNDEAWETEAADEDWSDDNESDWTTVSDEESDEDL